MKNVATDISVTKALVEEFGVYVEVPDAFIAALAVLKMHILFCEAFKAKLIERGQVLTRLGIHFLADLVYHIFFLI